MSHMGQNRNFEGFLVRGAIVREQISHEDQTVFGEALIEGYRLESEVVRFPRVMIASEVYHDAAVTSSKWSDALRSRIRQADDGPYYLHILRPPQYGAERTNSALSNQAALGQERLWRPAKSGLAHKAAKSLVIRNTRRSC
jgi:hypothetical protein